MIKDFRRVCVRGYLLPSLILPLDGLRAELEEEEVEEMRQGRKKEAECLASCNCRPARRTRICAAECSAGD